MKIVLFGSTGMLGHYVKEYLFQKSYELVCIDRKDFDVESEKWEILHNLLNEQRLEKQDVIVNCVGAIPQKNCCPRKYIVLNTLFPHELTRWINKCHIIHITTDCVYSGQQGDYDETSVHDANDIYGMTKSLGEDERMCIIRTSIIGEELAGKNSLLEWVKKQGGGEIYGYENVLWNGVSCLQLAKIIEHVIRTDIFWTGKRHFFSPEPVSKYRLCKMINDIYRLNITVHKKKVPYKNMTLKSKYDTPVGLVIPSIQEQIQEQQGFVFTN